MLNINKLFNPFPVLLFFLIFETAIHKNELKLVSSSPYVYVYILAGWIEERISVARRGWLYDWAMKKLNKDT